MATVFWVRLDLLSIDDPEGNVIGLRVALTDINELKVAEHHLALAGEKAEGNLARLRTVVDNTDVGLVFSDAEGNLIEWNPAALAMVGFDDIQQARTNIKHFKETFELYSVEGRLVPFETGQYCGY